MMADHVLKDRDTVEAWVALICPAHANSNLPLRRRQTSLLTTSMEIRETRSSQCLGEFRPEDERSDSRGQ
jgi:hypothetical protein